ncbi:MAG: TetR/AcrR family transcriptional regulator [Firmicutes bacterium]|nr:TetR/AcrR family transcriptional regulator [Bacillota bacterium]
MPVERHEDRTPSAAQDVFAEALAAYHPPQGMTEKHRRIVEAALRIFAQKGYAGTSTAEIAREAGVAEATIFRHYKAKKDLLLSLVAPLMARLVGPVAVRSAAEIAGDPSLSLEEMLRRLIRDRLHFALENAPRFRILLQESFFHPELRDALWRGIWQQIHDVVAAALRQRMERGEIRPVDLEVAVRVLVSGVASFILPRLMGLQAPVADDEKEIAATVDILLKGLLQGPAGAAAGVPADETTGGPQGRPDTEA